jgi:hypothetical protein
VTKTQPGVLRIEALAQTRPVSVLDTKNGNRPVTINMDEINRANREEPGRYVTGGLGASALPPTALIEDIRGGANQVRTDLAAMPEFSMGDKLRLSVAVRSTDPHGAIDKLINGGALSAMTPEQQQYVIDLRNLMEQVMSLRSVLKAGQGAEDVRDAILATIPGPQTPDKGYALKQLDALGKTLDRVKKGIPQVPLAGGANELPGGITVDEINAELARRKGKK